MADVWSSASEIKCLHCINANLLSHFEISEYHISFVCFSKRILGILCNVNVASNMSHQVDDISFIFIHTLLYLSTRERLLRVLSLFCLQNAFGMQTCKDYIID